MDINELTIREIITGGYSINELNPETLEFKKVLDNGGNTESEYEIDNHKHIYLQEIGYFDVEKAVKLYEESKNEDEFKIKWNKYFNEV